jgi:Helix-turn-helix domain
MATEKPGEISDPKALRALAHPLRWKLLKLVDEEETATATRCAEVVGESVASCSYHLNMLAKYDFLEQVPGPGREKPWRVTNRNQNWSRAGHDLEGTLAAEAASEAFLQQEFEQLRDRMRLATDTGDWAEVTGLAGLSCVVTAEEAKALRAELMALLTRYDSRIDNPAERPEGARPVRFFLATSVAPPRPPRD